MLLTAFYHAHEKKVVLVSKFKQIYFSARNTLLCAIKKFIKYALKTLCPFTAFTEKGQSLAIRSKGPITKPSANVVTTAFKRAHTKLLGAFLT